MSNTPEDTHLREQINDAIRDLSIQLSDWIFVTGKVSPKLHEYENKLEETIMHLITLHTDKAVKASRMSQEYFEANLLDGDDVNDCGGAMLSAENVWELIDEFNINISKGE